MIREVTTKVAINEQHCIYVSGVYITIKSTWFQLLFMNICAKNNELRDTGACNNIGVNKTVDFEFST